MVPACTAGCSRAKVLLQSVPESRPRACRDCVGSHTHHARIAARPQLSRFEDEVDAAARPSEAAGAIGEAARASVELRETPKQAVEPLQLKGVCCHRGSP